MEEIEGELEESCDILDSVELQEKEWGNEHSQAKEQKSMNVLGREDFVLRN